MAWRAALKKAWSDFKSKVRESLFEETVTDEGDTSATNNSSVICLLSIDGNDMLLTGDAGIEALDRAADVLAARDAIPGGLRFVQVPHHGSRHNVGPTVLNRILGEITEDVRGTAFISAAKKGRPRHPAKVTQNAFKRRGYSTHVTAGESIRHQQGAPDRDGWSPLTPDPLYEEVETFD